MTINERIPKSLKRVRGGIVGRVTGARRNGIEFLLLANTDADLQAIWELFMTVPMARSRIINGKLTKAEDE